MLVHQLATAADVRRLVGDVDPLFISRILALAPTRDELDQALQELDDVSELVEEPRTPSSARVAAGRAILDDLAMQDDFDQEEVAHASA